jgi:dTDP-4-amino-4,6-dideoxygalactose transaminase
LEIVSLPMFPQLKQEQLALVTSSVKEFATSKIGAAR